MDGNLFELLNWFWSVLLLPLGWLWKLIHENKAELRALREEVSEMREKASDNSLYNANTFVSKSDLEASLKPLHNQIHAVSTDVKDIKDMLITAALKSKS